MLSHFPLLRAHTQCKFLHNFKTVADTGSILDLYIQYEVLSMRDIVEEDTWGLYVYKNVCSIVQSYIFIFCTNSISIGLKAQERSENKSSQRYLDSTRSRLELCSLKGGGCEGDLYTPALRTWRLSQSVLQDCCKGPTILQLQTVYSKCCCLMNHAGALL